MTRRPFVYHSQIAAKARTAPGQWVYAQTYATGCSASSMARKVRAGDEGGGLAYRPAGHYDARIDTVDTGVAVWVRYLPGTPAALAAGLRWLFDTEQPDTAIVTHLGMSIPGAGNRWYGLCPSGADGQVVISTNVARVTWARADGDTYAANPIAYGEVAWLKGFLGHLGHTVTATWNGYPGTSGSLALAEAPHPSLTAAVDRYRAGCPAHPTAGVFCDCEAWKQGIAAAVRPSYTATKPRTGVGA
ncbi:hypothetical protein HHL19_16195 [Streptomyces sp. R302]|uniref:hypothetical protein n=1 Tax=unclassified Streptomyces TaxID=2593676 RepID=UPI00145EF295|nr:MULTISPECIES: hypothetical protein [unclassified Streptomyces]NML55314.1 hypothetical protein [Streptomyces sp. R301]NML80186.1 hypothetical protein [Streptomyces sp. R302]